jgi:hypothetical protein
MKSIQLYMGECDGYREACTSDRPDIYYAVPLAIASEIAKLKDPIAKETAYKTNARLAYVFEEVKTFPEEGMVFCYRRCAEQDKTSDPATSL